MFASQSYLHQGPTAPQQSMRVLVVDDEKNIAELVAAILRSADYVTETAFTCRGALEKATATVFDIFIVDILLPDGDGATLINNLKDVCPDAAFVAMTGSNSKEMEERVREQRVVYYLIKPFEYQELLDVCNHIMKRKIKERNRTGLSLHKSIIKGISKCFTGLL